MKNEMLQKQMIRHGELLIVPVDRLPETVEQIFEGKQYIIGHSETGHHHLAVATKAKGLTVYKPKGADSQDIYLRVSAPSKVEHQKTFDKHQTFDLNEGLYLVRPKNEYDPFRKVIERVRD